MNIFSLIDYDNESIKGKASSQWSSLYAL